ncbi:YihY/virulence factor BrkB family protein [Alkalicoccus chagannorensis]|uniref:YihY/virulence factor BrkB family protein n=1 Tax=Alkalicoccus chagannorensis TaxID=427072 RepID=UPI0004202A1E|nr:YihY/virulence factor BrkB family protein [Alkalicoccus chagannorensis]
MRAIKEFFRRFQEHGLIHLGAQSAYFLLLSIFPFLIVVVSLLSYLPFSYAQVYQLLQQIYIPPGVLEVIENQWDILTAQNQPGLLSFGALFTLWTASLGMNSILRSLNLAYKTTEKRSLLFERFIALGLTLGMFIVILLALFLQGIGSQVQEWLALDFVIFDMNLFRWVLTSTVIFSVFLLLYWVGPSVRLRFRDVYIGALTATAGWQLLSYAFSMYLNQFADFSATYGTIGTVIALMLWFHLASLILLIGGEINAMRKEEKLLRFSRKQTSG